MVKFSVVNDWDELSVPIVPEYSVYNSYNANSGLLQQRMIRVSNVLDAPESVVVCVIVSVLRPMFIVKSIKYVKTR